jgi:hypothetical protein
LNDHSLLGELICVIRSFSHLKKDGKNQQALQHLRCHERTRLSFSAQFPRALPENGVKKNARKIQDQRDNKRYFCEPG